ncbi:MAG TPA: hypothetical protein VF719_01020 [Abditibacteriaceae bacterium]
MLFGLLMFAPINVRAKNESYKIAYQRSLPESAKVLIPRGAKNYFWGTFQLRPQGDIYGINLIDPNWEKNYDNWLNGKHIVLFANLFLFSDGKWKHLRRCRIAYRGYDTSRMQVSLELLWLKPRQRHGPIFKIRAFGYEVKSSYVLGAGDETLIVFPRGLEGEYAVQSFYIGYWRASDTLGSHVSYDNTDKRGLLKLIRHESLNDDIYRARLTIYEWKWRRFVKVRSDIRRG